MRPLEFLGSSPNYLAGRGSWHLLHTCACCVGGCSLLRSLCTKGLASGPISLHTRVNQEANPRQTALGTLRAAAEERHIGGTLADCSLNTVPLDGMLYAAANNVISVDVRTVLAAWPPVAARVGRRSSAPSRLTEKCALGSGTACAGHRSAGTASWLRAPAAPQVAQRLPQRTQAE